MSDEILVKVEDLDRYYGRRAAVCGLSFELAKGEVLGFLGPNGAGKTTTMQMLSGNLSPTAGSIEINGIDLLDLPKDAKRAIGYLPEQPPVYMELRVDEYLDYCARLNRVPRSKIRAAREDAKARCGLADVGRRLIGNLSKGYRQRVGIAQAIVHMPPVVILDEPTVGLDPIQIREIRALIAELGEAHSVILSSHILPEIQAVCSRVQIIHQGRLVLSDTIEGLGERMQSESLIVGARSLPNLDMIAAIPDVARVEAIDAHRVRVFHASDANPTEYIARCAVDGGWGLTELTPEHKSLEEIFVDLTQTESNDAKDAA
ncbi:MAG TPA: ABC transporter ATP-binding protein [Gammaproteobacteria bacterium]|nr:ABC transporter ATP-binding protein [Gammaproteobacteria bacterium]